MEKRIREEGQNILPLKKRPRLDLFYELEESEIEAIEGLLLLGNSDVGDDGYVVDVALVSNPKITEKKMLLLESSHTKKNEQEIELYSSDVADEFDHEYGAKYVIVKTLNASDVDDRQACLAIPGAHVITSNFLSESEVNFLKERAKDSKFKNKISVKVRGRYSVEDYNMFLTRWDYDQKRGYKYVLNGGWNKLGKESCLRKGDEIKVVSFRLRDGCLCFAIDGGRKVLSWGRTGRRGSNNVNFSDQKVTAVTDV